MSSHLVAGASAFAVGSGSAGRRPEQAVIVCILARCLVPATMSMNFRVTSLEQIADTA